MAELMLLGKIIMRGEIKVKTGLAIGGSTGGLEIGGVDNPVIKDKNGKPFIPGSSLKGKLRSLLEKADGKKFDSSHGNIHICSSPTEFANCSVCKIFGVPGEKKFGEPTRLIVRDSFLTAESENELLKTPTDTEFTEVKFENTIDRITSAANPRQMERVPAGASFAFEMIYNVFDEADKTRFRDVLKAMELLEHDYLGGSGSRGYGKIWFTDIKLLWNSIQDYQMGNIEDKNSLNGEHVTVVSIMQHFDEIIGGIQ